MLVYRVASDLCNPQSLAKSHLLCDSYCIQFPQIMANLINKLSRTSSSLRIFSNIKTLTELPKPPLTLLNTNNPILCLDSKTTDKPISTQKLPFYPSFPFGYCLNPISSSGFDQLETLEAEKVESDDASTVWADSVKKKRKKKMNKHKYKKLRKLLRRKT